MNLKDYENEQRKNINGRARKVKRVIDEALRQAILIAVSTDYDGEGDFFFDSYPTASSRMDDLQKDLANMLTSNIKSGDNAAAKISAKKMESILEWAREKSGRKLINNAAGKAISRNISEGLSNRVWNLTEQFKQEMELSVEAGMEKGMSANELSRKVRGYLNDPDKLFRRVRDKSGVLRLSKAAKAYHPGRGVYRSSYKNAMRMTVTEINSAYREADHERWKETSFILGIEIKITNGRHEPDICDDLKGRYPKDFKFTGWHPWCRCYAVPILPSVEEFKNWDGKSGFGEVEYDGVEKLQKWAKENAVRIEKAKTMPAFLKDNEKFWKKGKDAVPDATVKPISPEKVKHVKGYSAIAAYDNGGKVYKHNEVSKEDSDYDKLVDVANFFAKQGKEVRLTPKKRRRVEFDYDEIYGSLKGTKYYGKCPDMSIDGVWYEHEGFVTSNPKRAFSNMLHDGLLQSNRLIIDRPELTERFMRRGIFNRVRHGEGIEEVWLRNGDGTLSLLYKKTDG